MDLDVIINEGLSHEIDLPIIPEVTIEQDMTIKTHEPVISYEFLPTGISTDGQIYWRGAEISEGGKMYSMPYWGDEILITDTNTDTVSAGPNVMGFPHSNERAKWIDADRAPSGKIWSAPRAARGTLVIDPMDDSFELVAPVNYEFAMRGTICLDDWAYTVPYFVTSKLDIKRFNTATEVYDGLASFTPSLSGPLYDGRPNYVAESGFFNYLRMWGGVNGGNGKVYTVPLSADRIFIIDHDPVLGNVSISEGQDYLNGNWEVPVGTSAISPLNPLYRPYLLKYSDGVKAPNHNACYCMPRCANSILKINTLTDQCTELPLPADLLAWIENNYGDFNNGKSLGTIVGPDGRIWSAPWQLPIVIFLNPSTDEIGWINLEEILTTENTGTTFHWYAYGRAAGKSIYYSPSSANSVMKLTIN